MGFLMTQPVKFCVFQLFLFSILVARILAVAPVEMKAPGVTLRAASWDQIVVGNEQGVPLITFTGFAVKWRPTVLSDGGTLRALANDEHTQTLEEVYQFPDGPTGGKIEGTASFTPRPHRVDVHYKITGIPDGADLGGCMFGRRLPAGAESLPVVKLGLWKRHEYGGIPMEYPDGRFLPFRANGNLFVLAFGEQNKFTPEWADGTHQHTGMVKTGPGVYEASFSILLLPPEWPFEASAACWHDRPVALHIATDHPYNWWENKDTPLELKATLVNTSQAQRTVQWSHWIRNFAGEIVSQDKREVTLAAGKPVVENISFTPSTQRDIFFAEVSAVDKASGQEVFARANLILLPPCVFKSTPADSVIGLAGEIWPYPSKPDIQRLLQRLGLRWLRQDKTRDYSNNNLIANRHDNIDLKESRTDAERESLIRDSLQHCIDDGNPAWEFANEINYDSLNIGLGNTLGDEARAHVVETYVGWLKEIRRIQSEMGPKAKAIKILSTGLAGMDVRFVEALHDAGGWDLLDGISLHPGRGNFTADYPVYDPSSRAVPWEEWKVGPHGNYWNYYGSVLTAKNLIARYGGGKELWLTEVYSPGWPNTFWDDSPRNGAENAVLSYALGQAEGVKAVMWHQLFDSVWWDRFGVNPKDREYFFGMIMRDGSPKPVFMAVCAIAEALDQAKFKGWIAFPKETNPKTRGLHFDTPRGPMSILWDRSDGYVLTQDKPDFVSPEAWVDTWKTHTPVSIRTKGDKIHVINAIGQEQTVPAPGSKATLQLTGAPVIVYGMDAPLLK